MPEYRREPPNREGRVRVYHRRAAGMGVLRNEHVCRWCGRFMGGELDGRQWDAALRAETEAELGRPVAEFPAERGDMQPAEPLPRIETDAPEEDHFWDISGGGPCDVCDVDVRAEWRRRAIERRAERGEPPADGGAGGGGVAS